MSCSCNESFCQICNKIEAQNEAVQNDPESSPEDKFIAQAVADVADRLHDYYNPDH